MLLKDKRKIKLEICSLDLSNKNDIKVKSQKLKK